MDETDENSIMYNQNCEEYQNGTFPSKESNNDKKGKHANEEYHNDSDETEETSSIILSDDNEECQNDRVKFYTSCIYQRLRLRLQIFN